MSERFFPREQIDNFNPRIYAYRDSNPEYQGLLKIGYTTRDVKTRVKEQYPVVTPNQNPFEILLDESSIRNDGSTFNDKDVHKILISKGIFNSAGEWFRCSVQDVKSAIKFLQSGESFDFGRDLDFGLRPEQQEAINN